MMSANIIKSRNTKLESHVSSFMFHVIRIMKLQPLSDYIIIEPQKQEIKTKSGIVLPDTVEKEKPQEGKVIAVGSGRTLESGARAKMQVKAGDRVLFTKYSPTEVKIDGKEFYVIKEDDIMAIIK